MHISVEPRDDYAILHLRGEFDTFYAPLLQQEIDALAKAGIHRVVLNLRLVRFLNSTALGAMVKAGKQLSGKGGRLVLSRPSPFCRDIIGKVGLDRVLGVFDNDEAASEAVMAGIAPQGRVEPPKADDHPSTVLFSPLNLDRVEHFLPESARHPKPPTKGSQAQEKTPPAWSGAGRMSAIDTSGLRFTWNGGSTGLSPFAMAQFLAIGTEWRIRFRLPLLGKGYREATCAVTEVEERPEGIKVGASFQQIDTTTRDEIKQYANDLAYLKDELKKVTDR